MVSVLSCVPKQLHSFSDKMEWLAETARKNLVDLLITPQEFFGGVVVMPDRRWFSKEELLPKLKPICRRNKTSLVVGVCERLADCNKEALWFLDHHGEFVGSFYKMALPKYDHVATKGSGRLTPETDIDTRLKVFELAGLRLSGIFCWEVYSSVLWTGIGLAKPDIVCNCIKFGPNAWPQVRREGGESVVKGFGYGSWPDDTWVDRMKVASLWETRCPIISSTNSWGLRAVSKPICGCWSGLLDQGPQSLWMPAREDGSKIPEKIVVDEIDPKRIRAARKNKWAYTQDVGEFPSTELMKYTMLLKIARVEDRLLSGREQQHAMSQSGAGGSYNTFFES